MWGWNLYFCLCGSNMISVISMKASVFMLASSLYSHFLFYLSLYFLCFIILIVIFISLMQLVWMPINSSWLLTWGWRMLSPIAMVRFELFTDLKKENKERAFKMVAIWSSTPLTLTLSVLEKMTQFWGKKKIV